MWTVGIQGLCQIQVDEAKAILQDHFSINPGLISAKSLYTIKDDMSLMEPDYNFPQDKRSRKSNGGIEGLDAFGLIFQDLVIARKLYRIVNDELIWLHVGGQSFGHASRRFLGCLFLLFHLLGG